MVIDTIFTPENIRLIREGKKTETRRIWKRNHVLVGKVYQCRVSQYKKTPEDSPRIKILSMRKEQLAEISKDSDAIKREGCSSIAEFIQEWIALHGGWKSTEEVYVIRFELVK